jgi:hypothetical protein
MEETQAVSQAQPETPVQPTQEAQQQQQPAQPEPLFQPAAKSVFDLFSDSPRKEAAPMAPAAPVAPEPEAQDPAAEAEQPAQAVPETEQTIEEIIAELKQQHPETPEVVLKRMADKEAYIRTLKAKQDAQSKQITELMARVVKKEETPRPAVTELERQALGQTAQPAPAQPPPIQQPVPNPEQIQQQPAIQQPALPEYLRTPEMAYAELSSALAQGDFSHAHEVEEQMFGLRMAAMAPNIQAMIQAEARKIVQESVGDVLPAVRQSVEQQKAEFDKEVALSELERAGEGEIRKLLEPLSDTPIEVNGKRFADTEANRVIAENPWILNILVSHEDPRMAYRLTLINRYRAIGQMSRLKQGGQSAPAPAAPAAPGAAASAPASGIPPEQAQALVQAGRDQAQREEQDRIRAAMNGGRLPATAADGKDQIGRLTSRSGSWADMFRPA